MKAQCSIAFLVLISLALVGCAAEQRYGELDADAANFQFADQHACGIYIGNLAYPMAEALAAEVIDSSAGEQLSIYFGGWLFESVSGPIPPHATRSQHQMTLQTNDAAYAREVLRWLAVDTLQANPLQEKDGKPMFGSALLVVDVLLDEQVARTYFSDGCYLYGDDGRTRRRVDQDFRERFDFGTPGFDEEAVCSKWYRATRNSKP